MRPVFHHLREIFGALTAGALLVGGLAGCARNSGGNTGRGGADPSEFSHDPQTCQNFIAHLPKDYIHDWLDVPENPLAPSGPRIQVFYYGKISRLENVILFYNGGPAADSHGSSVALSREVAQRGLGNRISFLYMDQRGTGCSSRYPAGSSDDVVERLKFYGSTGIVYDSEALRLKLLGSRKWKVFGQSYGAFIVHRYVALFPRALEKAYAHANAVSPDPLTRLEERIASQIRVTGLYLLTYPDDAARLRRLADLLTDSVCARTIQDRYCGHVLLSGLVGSLGWTNEWPQLHATVGSLVSAGPGSDQIGTATLNMNALQKLARRLDEEDPAAGWASTVIGVFDRNVVAEDTANCSEVYRRLRASLGADFQDGLINECMGAVRSNFHSTFRDHVADILRGRLDVLSIEAVRAGIALMAPFTFFLYSGERDCYVPKVTFVPELNAFGSNVNYVNFPATGHDGYRTEDQVWHDLQI